MDTNEQTAEADDMRRHNNEVTVTYNSNPVRLHRGSYTVAELRKIFGTPANEILVQFIDGKFVDKTEGHIVVKQDEIFASRNPQGGASS